MTVELKENIERNPEELMQEAASDELFLADLNETMEDFGHVDQEDQSANRHSTVLTDD